MINCKQCHNILQKQTNQYHCNNCGQDYPIQNGIVIMESEEGVDLRPAGKLLDIHELIKERKFYGKFIKSDVDFYARWNGVKFTDYHVQSIKPYLDDSIIVDMGCGQIPYVNALPNSKIKAFFGIDLDKPSLKIAQKNFHKKFPWTLIKDNVMNVPFASNSVDIIISSEILEHLEHPISYLREIYRICKKGGYLSLSTPCVSIHYFPHTYLRLFKYLKHPKKWYRRVYKAIYAHNYWKEALSWHPGLRPAVLRDWARKAGFSVIHHTSRLWFVSNPLRIAWRFFSLLEKLGFSESGKIFYRFLQAMEKIILLNVPVIKWLGTRQFILCQKT